MQISKATYAVFIIVITVMTLSVTVFTGGKGSPNGQQHLQTRQAPIYNLRDRFPVAEYDEQEPTDPAKRAKLRKQKQQYDKDAPFYSNVRPQDAEIAWRPEAAFDFPAFPIARSDVIVIGQVLSAEAHRSNNKRNVFSNFELRVDEVLKGNNLTAGTLITTQRIGGYVVFPNGQRVLFRLSAHGMPAIGARYALFLNNHDEDYSILTGYELGAEGVAPLDYSNQFKVHQGESEIDFLKALREAVQAVSD